MTTKFKIIIREEDIKVRKKQAPASKPFKNKNYILAHYVHTLGLKSIRQTSGISKLS